MKKIIRFLIWIIAAVIIILVSLVGVIRKDKDVSSNLAVVYCTTEMPIGDSEMIQHFVAKESRINALKIGLSFDNNEGVMHFSLNSTESEKTVINKDILLSDIESGELFDIEINKNIKKGKDYYYTVSVSDNPECVYPLCTNNENDIMPGEGALYIDSINQEDYSSAMWIIYGERLNVKNIFCICAMIIAIALMLDHVVYGGFNNKILKKLDEFIEKNGIVFCIFTMVLSAAMLIRMARNEAVDWDESYTWWITTKMSVKEMLKTTASDVHPPLYYLICIFAKNIFGKNIFVYKLVSVFFTLLSEAWGILFIRKRWGTKAAIAFMISVSLCPQFAFFSVYTRMYSMLIFFVTGAFVFSCEIILEDRWWKYLGLAICSLGTIYTMYFGAIPLFIIYVFTGIYLLIKRRKNMWKILCTALVVCLGYLPWIRVVASMVTTGSTSTVKSFEFDFSGLLSWAFETNIEISEYMPFVLLIFGVIAYVVTWKKNSFEQKYIVIALSLFFIVTDLLSLTINMFYGHFWDNRYVLSALFSIWMLLAIIYSSKGVLTFIFYMIWLGITALSSYVIASNQELRTIPWIDNAKEVFAEAQNEENMLYGYSDFDIYYGYFFQNTEFVWWEDFNPEEYPENHIYMVAWGTNGGEWFPFEFKTDKQIYHERKGQTRLEQGVLADLYYLYW